MLYNTPMTSTPFASPIDIISFIDNLLKGLVNAYPSIVATVKNILGILIGISLPASFIFLIVIIYCVERLKYIRAREKEIFDLKVEPAYEATSAADHVLAKRWNDAQTHVESANQNDWRQAILEADIILDDLLNKLGYRGESIGEKLKRAHTGDFKSLNEAWEAHKIRNRLVHEGANFELNQIEAKRILNMYKKVFEEFYYI